jgi:hypothetical protein
MSISHCPIFFGIALISAANALAAENHIANCGTVFVRDFSHPSLKEAYRDPSGLIWGAPADGWMNQQKAEDYCRSLHARLPSREEFVQLIKFLGDGSASGYSPYQSDEQPQVLPGIGDGWFWSSTLGDGGIEAQDAYELSGEDGLIGITARHQFDFVRCVAGP